MTQHAKPHRTRQWPDAYIVAVKMPNKETALKMAEWLEAHGFEPGIAPVKGDTEPVSILSRLTYDRNSRGTQPPNP